MSIKIENDQQLREALNDLPLKNQRQLGGRFVASVSHLSSHPAVSRGLEVAANPGRTDSELENAYQGARKLAVDSYTACGRDADWSAQAEHFVASAMTACLTTGDQIEGQENLAWRAAMQARMAKNCEMILNDKGELDNEAIKQYSIAENFLT